MNVLDGYDFSDMKAGNRRVIKDTTSPSGFSYVEKQADESIQVYHLQDGEMPFLLKGSYSKVKG